MGEQIDLYGAPGPEPSTNVVELLPEPPLNGRATYTEWRTIDVDKLTSMQDVARAPVKVSVVGEAILSGPQEAKALALLGISEETLDYAWRAFVVDVNGPTFLGSADWGQAHQHQEGMGWQVDVEVLQERTTRFVALADIDPRHAKRWVTYRAKRWYYTQADIDAGTTDGPPGGFEVVTKREPLEASGALGAAWRTVNEDEIESTVNSAEALLAARMELGNARNEIQVALKVADAAWQGPRSEITKFMFGLDYEIVSAAWDSADAWRKYLDDLVKHQRDALEESDALKRELGVEVALLIVGGVGGKLLKLTFSAGRGVVASLAGGKVLSYAEKIARIVAPLRARYGVVLDRIVQSSKVMFATRVLARGTGALATTAAVNGAGGRPTTTEDWVLAYLLAGAGQGASDGIGLLLKNEKVLEKIKLKHKVNFVEAVIEPAKSVADGGVQIPIKAGFTDDALAVPFGLGLGSDALRRATDRNLKKLLGDRLTDELWEVPNSPQMQRAQKRLDDERRARDPEGTPHGPQEDLHKLDQYFREEVQKTVDRQVDPLFDFTYSLGTQAAENVHKTLNPPPPSRNDLPDAPSGTIAQRVGR